MGTIPFVAVQSSLESTCEAIAVVTKTKEQFEPESCLDLGQLNARIDKLMKRLTKDHLNTYAIGVHHSKDWTLLLESQAVFPTEALLLNELSEKLRTVVVGLLIQTTSGSFGLIVCDRGRILRNFMSVDNNIEIDEGKLDDETPLLRDNPWQSVEANWKRLVPGIDVEAVPFELRVFSDLPIPDEPDPQTQKLRQRRKPWWKLW